MIHASASRAAQTFQRLTSIIERDMVMFDRWHRQMDDRIRIDLDVFTPANRRAVILSTEAK